MKMTAIAKASLALSILATGVITSTAQTVDASEHESKYENVTKDIFDLRDYYSGASKELKNVTGESSTLNWTNSMRIDIVNLRK